MQLDAACIALWPDQDEDGKGAQSVEGFELHVNRMSLAETWSELS